MGLFSKSGGGCNAAKDYDLVAFFDCLHDMGDPVGAGKHVKETLAKDGSWMIVEPFAHDNLKDNLNPVGCIFYHASFARRHHSLRKWAWGSVPRRVKADCVRSRLKRASGASAARPRRRST
jgi:hypothetical protein